jgi:hypothetical protein
VQLAMGEAFGIIAPEKKVILLKILLAISFYRFFL